MQIFSKKIKTEKEEKEKERQKKIDKIIEMYDKNKQENNKDDDSKFLGMPFLKRWSKNNYADRFLKCLSPAFAIIGLGAVFWGAGFVLNELSKASSFLRDLTLPTKISGLITTVAFWKVIGIVALSGVAIFIFLTIFSVIKNKLYNFSEYKKYNKNNDYLQEYKQYSMDKYKPKNINNYKNYSVSNKYSYDNYKKNKYNDIYNAEEKPKNSDINFYKNCKDSYPNKKNNNFNNKYSKANFMKNKYKN